MASLYCWDVNCATDGVQTVWAETAPTECPLDGGHEVTGVTRTLDEGQAHNHMNINDGAGRVFKLTVDQNGNLSAAQIAGDPPA